mmetsp:Transcript_7409/g.12778  ORF Transcript_7409/g.12778 Transcript_7409/m.12778 type:complete len:307 (-) Transcript_7409:672-1592(-)|eukprot:CAMPEP_0119105160 /NCGR_PEP_ID=MMETSP1180-20130426/3200_1 /TAXON_ID=3052 ORGANISM="Chlamydomonas cf sp, Strain CCMP681" /NCGR_SAMPLE_ID=MMETSP1180 /ASSEMBLY_ACC=CAM_ASM_000741 /LENGTH=306 /DNA_ID=CAMNT_0007090145 /DNA_START=106 /DNA_END=1026 /DNA_ORIENTATION=-
MTRWMRTLEWALDRSCLILQPVFALIAIGGVGVDAFLFFRFILPQVLEAHGTGIAVAHSAIGAWFLFNVVFNQAMSTFKSAGNTLEVNPQVLQEAATLEWRWCYKCNRGKPPLSHHCSLCGKCVFCMDHHCPWLANCIGWANYRYFLLYCFYMWIGSAYSVCMTQAYVPHLFAMDGASWPWLHFSLFVLAAAVFVALTAILGWHGYLIVTGMGTIDAMAAFVHQHDAEKHGGATPIWINPYNLGAKRNFQEAFEAHGRWWWLTWMLPSSKQKQGRGWSPPRAQGFENYDPGPYVRVLGSSGHSSRV